MIDRVGNGNSYIPPYDRGGKKAARVEGDAPAFLLPGEDENGGVIWDRGPKDDIPRSAAREQKKEENKDRNINAGSIYETDRSADTDEEELKQSGFGKLLGRIGEAIKSFFLSLWYGGDKAEDKKDNDHEAPDITADTEDSSEEAVTDNAQTLSAQRIKKAIDEKDTDALVDELTEGGKKHPARSTTLLTHYDRRGRIVKQDDSEVGRILGSDGAGRGKSGRNVERRPQGNYRRYI